MNPMPLALKDCLPSTGAEGLSPWLVVLAVVVIVGGAALILATKRTRASAAVGIIARDGV